MARVVAAARLHGLALVLGSQPEGEIDDGVAAAPERMPGRLGPRPPGSQGSSTAPLRQGHGADARPRPRQTGRRCWDLAELEMGGGLVQFQGHRFQFLCGRGSAAHRRTVLFAAYRDLFHLPGDVGAGGRLFAYRMADSYNFV